MNGRSKQDKQDRLVSFPFQEYLLSARDSRKILGEGSRSGRGRDRKEEKKERKKESDNVRPAIKGSAHRSKVARRRRRRRRMIEGVRARARDNPPYS